MTRKKLWLGIAIAGLAILIGLVLASGILIKPFLEYKIRENGFPKANIESVRVIPRGLLLENVYLDPEGFSTIDAVQVTSSWSDILLRKKIDAITFKNVEISGEIDEQGQMVIAGWDATPLTKGSGGGMTLQNINVDGLTLDFETPEGAIRAEGKLTLQEKKDGSRDFQASLWGKQKQLSLTITSNGNINPNGVWQAEVEINDGRLDVTGIKASRASGKVALTGGGGTPLTYAGQFSAGGLRIKDIPFQDTAILFDSAKMEIVQFKTNPTGYGDIVVSGRITNSTPPVVQAAIDIKDMKDVVSLLELKKEDMAWVSNLDPLSLKLSIPVSSFSSPAIAAAWSATAGKSAQVFTGTAELDRAKHLISGTLIPLKISGKNLASLIPLEDRTEIAISGGTLTASGNFAYDYEQSPVKISGKLDLKSDNLSGQWQEYPFEGVSGTVSLSQLFPWVISKPQSIKISSVGTGVNLDDGVLEFKGSQISGFSVSKASFASAGGSISTKPFTWKQGAKENAVTVVMENINLNQLASSVGTGGFVAEGQLTGTLPVVFTSKGLIFKEGTVNSTGEGMFKYTPTAYPSALQGDDTRMDTVRRALSDFHFSVLQVSVNGALDGDLKTTLKATGKNPVFGERPINLNINLEGALMPVLQEALQPGQIADSIEKSITGDH